MSMNNNVFATSFPDHRRAYDGLNEVMSDLTGMFCQEKGRTQQNFVKECDINVLMAQSERNGIIDHFNRYRGEYADVTGTLDFHAAQNAVIAAAEAFMSLPARVRAKFANDPGAFLAFVEDPENEDEMREIGLLPPAKPEAGVEPAAAAKAGAKASKSSAEGPAGDAKPEGSSPSGGGE